MTMLDRLQKAFAATVAAAVRSLPYAGEYRYSVRSCSWENQTLDVDPLDSGQPAHLAVPMHTPGIRLDIAPGTEILLGYKSMSPERPYVACFGNSPGSVLRADLLGGTHRIPQGEDFCSAIADALTPMLTHTLGNTGAPITFGPTWSIPVTGGKDLFVQQLALKLSTTVRTS